MTESFSELFEESLKELEMAPGSIVVGTVVAIENDFVVVHAGLKSEGVIPRQQFLDDNGELSIKVGDQVKVALEAVEDGFGSTQLSREKAKRAEAWAELEQAYEKEATVTGMITGKVRGGFTVNVNSINAFLPGSLVDIRPIRDTSHLEGQELEFKLVKLDARRNNIVVSRRAVLEEVYGAEREKLLEQLEEGSVVKGIIKNLTDYGAFIDLGGVDGLLHITDIAWKRVKHPSELLNVGDEISVKVLRFDRERKRVSLGLKQLTEDPWSQLAERFAPGTRTPAKVTNLTDYGCFAEIAPGIEGLVHVSEMDWTNKNIHPSKVVQVGDEVEVMVLEIDVERRRISLGMKQCQANPWDSFAANHVKGDRVSGKIKSITDFGIFIGLEGGIDGLVHLSDLAWEQDGDEAVKNFRKGQEVEAQILSIDAERERIALGIKQLNEDPFSAFIAGHGKNSKLTAQVAEVTDKAVVLDVADGVQGSVKFADLAPEQQSNPAASLKPGDSLDVAVANIDRRNRTLSLSVRLLEDLDAKQAMQAAREQQVDVSGPTTIGDLIKAQMKKSES